MPLKRCSLLQCSCPPRRSVPSKKLGYWYDSGSNTASKHTRKHEDTSLYLSLISTWGKNNEFCLNSNEFGFISDSVSNVGSYKRNTWCNLSCPLQTYCHLITNEKLYASWQFSETYGIINYGTGWRKDKVNQCPPFHNRKPNGHWYGKPQMLHESKLVQWLTWWSSLLLNMKEDYQTVKCD